MNPHRLVIDHDHLTFHAGIVEGLAQRLLNAIAAQSHVLVAVPLATLPEPAQARAKGVALMALRSLNQGAVEVGLWRAAEAVAAEKFGRPLKDCEKWQQREARILAGVAITAYSSHLNGLTDQRAERETVGFIAQVKAAVAEWRSRKCESRSPDDDGPVKGAADTSSALLSATGSNPTKEAGSEPADSLFNLGLTLARSASVVPFPTVGRIDREVH